MSGVSLQDPPDDCVGRLIMARSSPRPDLPFSSARKVAVLGSTVAKNLFPGGDDNVGQQMQIRDVPFTVLGVPKSKGQNAGRAG